MDDPSNLRRVAAESRENNRLNNSGLLIRQLRGVLAKPVGRSRLGKIHSKAPRPYLRRHWIADAPDLVRDAVSEENTPVSTPTHLEFDLSLPIAHMRALVFDKKGKRSEASHHAHLLSLCSRSRDDSFESSLFVEGEDEGDKENVPPLSPLAKRSTNYDTKTWRIDPPPAPRVDTGMFDTDFQNLEASGSPLDIPSTERKAVLLKDRLQDRVKILRPDRLQELSEELGIDSIEDVRLETAIARSPHHDLTYPPTPRPDTGSWSWNMESGMDPASRGPATSNLDRFFLPPVTEPGPLDWGVPRERTVAAGSSTSWNMGHGLSIDDIDDPVRLGVGENGFTSDAAPVSNWEAGYAPGLVGLRSDSDFGSTHSRTILCERNTSGPSVCMDQDGWVRVDGVGAEFEISERSFRARLEPRPVRTRTTSVNTHRSLGMAEGAKFVLLPPIHLEEPRVGM